MQLDKMPPPHLSKPDSPYGENLDPSRKKTEEPHCTSYLGNCSLSLSQARQAQDMLAGAPHKPGKIVLEIAHP